MRGEFDLIARHFAPLAGDEAGAYGLRNDAAAIEPPPGSCMIATLDTMVAGVHFLPDDPAGMVSRKLLRVNLSDLAAMGAHPQAYLLSLSMAHNLSESWVADFAGGLGEDQREFACRLIGGDTTATPGPTSLSMTLLGYAERERILQRGTARAGDDIYVSGTIGDGALGLKVLQQDLTGLPETQATFLSERYRLPRPRVGLGWRLAEQGLATAAIDISDGLAADLGHICATSGLAAEVEVNRVPLSPATETALKREPRLLGDVLGGGDDYELMFTAAPSARDDLRCLSEALNLPLSRIGTMVDGEGVRLRNAAGNVVSLDRSGWTHF